MTHLGTYVDHTTFFDGHALVTLTLLEGSDGTFTVTGMSRFTGGGFFADEARRFGTADAALTFMRDRRRAWEVR